MADSLRMLDMTLSTLIEIGIPTAKEIVTFMQSQVYYSLEIMESFSNISDHMIDGKYNKQDLIIPSKNTITETKVKEKKKSKHSKTKTRSDTIILNRQANA